MQTSDNESSQLSSALIIRSPFTETTSNYDHINALINYIQNTAPPPPLPPHQQARLLLQASKATITKGAHPPSADLSQYFQTYGINLPLPTFSDNPRSPPHDLLQGALCITLLAASTLLPRTWMFASSLSKHLMQRFIATHPDGYKWEIPQHPSAVFPIVDCQNIINFERRAILFFL
ncbi:hypothetical protein BJ508DRAFT_302278 [Ascobolus immersus RN42]|uniref:Uncharacterized protein n=1 Tax=Ascobolus immersus RN42 TaxID=1160509 RepID=A0A3N4INV4_ASCIM|nr:hypothetical protein BJ508DRAFT_302278 [Ascobolus immersus RN42]